MRILSLNCIKQWFEWKIDRRIPFCGGSHGAHSSLNKAGCCRLSVFRCTVVHANIKARFILQYPRILKTRLNTLLHFYIFFYFFFFIIFFLFFVVSMEAFILLAQRIQVCTPPLWTSTTENLFSHLNQDPRTHVRGSCIIAFKAWLHCASCWHDSSYYHR